MSELIYHRSIMLEEGTRIEIIGTRTYLTLRAAQIMSAVAKLRTI